VRSENEGNLEVTVQVEAGRNYRLERSTDFLSWDPVLEWFADQAQLTTSVVEPNGTVFYRAVVVSTPLTD
jgi:hypothetical protein